MYIILKSEANLWRLDVDVHADIDADENLWVLLVTCVDTDRKKEERQKREGMTNPDRYGDNIFEKITPDLKKSHRPDYGKDATDRQKVHKPSSAMNRWTFHECPKN